MPLPATDIHELLGLYRREIETPRRLIAKLCPELERSRPDNIWISLCPADMVERQLLRLEEVGPDSLPLYGIPFAVKDNIDIAGMPTTAACPDFSRVAESTAPVVQRLMDLGAIVVGKTNMDQFATGLVGTRSPYGTAVNALNGDYIPGGSSSGSAVAVARRLVVFALGTDTAGSGRVPAAMNGIAGLKPSRGVLSCRGVIPACQSLDCVSIFARDTFNASLIYRALCDGLEPDHQDPYSRAVSFEGPWFAASRKKLVVGIPSVGELEFFGCSRSRQSWETAIQTIADTGIEFRRISFEPLFEAARLLYGGPWVAERYLACRTLIEDKPEALHPVTRAVIQKGRDYSALDCFTSQYQLENLRRKSWSLINSVDALLTPTIGRPWTLAEVADDPVERNTDLGYYTNFMNLLDLAAVAFPAGELHSGLKFGLTLFSRAFSDFQLLEIASSMERLFMPEGDSRMESLSPSDPFFRSVRVAVCGAHLDGLPLNHQLRDLGARLVLKTRTAPVYRLYDLMETHLPVRRPGLIRVDAGGDSIEVEVWEMPEVHFGSFVAAIPAPLGIGKCLLSDGTQVCGFTCESVALGDARDVTSFGGWRTYLESLNS